MSFSNVYYVNMEVTSTVTEISPFGRNFE